MKKIEGSPKNLKQLLQNTKYSIHYYQREYMWQKKHIEELIDDLTSEFLDNYKVGDARHQLVPRYAFSATYTLADNNELSILCSATIVLDFWVSLQSFS